MRPRTAAKDGRSRRAHQMRRFLGRRAYSRHMPSNRITDSAQRALRASTWEQNPKAPLPAGRGPNGRPRRRSRHGRELRGYVIPPTLPGYRSRSERFDELAIAVVQRLETRWSRQLDGTEFAVEEVPPSDPARWETGGVPLGRYFPAQPGIPPRIVLYRRPIESRAHTVDELLFIVRNVLIEQVAHFLGKRPDEVDPGYGFF